ncbi:MAG: hypothetical protein ABL970_08945 [Nitrospira sp.]
MQTATRQSPPKKRPGQGCGPHRIDGAAMDLRSAAAFFGGTEKQTRGLVARRLIPFRRLGGRIIFLKTELEVWLQTLDGCTPDEARQNGVARYERRTR